MPRRSPRTNRIPSYRLHKPSGQAVVTLCGRDIYLGAHGSPPSRAEYDRVVAEWIAAGRVLVDEPASMSIDELVLAYWRDAKRCYQTRTLEATIRPALRRLRRLYGGSPACEFGPRGLKAVRETMIGEDLSRSYINAQIRWIRACFRWGVEEELVSPTVLQGLEAVRGLRRGRSPARDTNPIGPVDDAVVDATIPFMPEMVGDMVRIQRITGMRPGELCRVTTGEIDTSGDVWLYRPKSHKTAHHGHDRVIPIGPLAQRALAPYVRTELEQPVFSPRISEQRRRAAQRQRRTSPLTPSQRRRAEVHRSSPSARVGDRYSVDSYRQAIWRACDRAGVPRWAPNQLRHARATELRRQFGLDAAGAILGHSRLETTQIYAERNLENAIGIALKTG